MIDPKVDTTTAGVLAPPPLLYLGPLLVALAVERWGPWPLTLPAYAKWPGVGLIILGLVVALVPAVVVLIRAGTRPEPWKPTTALVTDGIYRYTRNPMYLGMAAIYLGVALFTRSGWGLALFPIALLLIEFGVIRREERYLTGRFGEAYSRYLGQVRRWL